MNTVTQNIQNTQADTEVVVLDNCRVLRGLARLVDPHDARDNLQGVHVSLIPGVGVFAMATDGTSLGVYRLADLDRAGADYSFFLPAVVARKLPKSAAVETVLYLTPGEPDEARLVADGEVYPMSAPPGPGAVRWSWVLPPLPDDGLPVWGDAYDLGTLWRFQQAAADFMGRSPGRVRPGMVQLFPVGDGLPALVLLHGNRDFVGLQAALSIDKRARVLESRLGDWYRAVLARAAEQKA